MYECGYLNSVPFIASRGSGLRPPQFAYERYGNIELVVT